MLFNNLPFPCCVPQREGELMTRSKWILTLAGAPVLLALSACAGPYSGGGYYYASTPPPPPAPLAVGVAGYAPGRGYVWRDGYWDWRGNRYSNWVPGRWERPSNRHSTWVAPHWERRGSRHEWVRGYWH